MRGAGALAGLLGAAALLGACGGNGDGGAGAGAGESAMTPSKRAYVKRADRLCGAFYSGPGLRLAQDLDVAVAGFRPDAWSDANAAAGAFDIGFTAVLEATRRFGAALLRMPRPRADRELLERWLAIGRAELAALNDAHARLEETDFAESAQRAAYRQSMESLERRLDRLAARSERLAARYGFRVCV